MFRLVYFFATLTTSRRFAATIRSFARRPACSRFFSSSGLRPAAAASSTPLGLLPPARIVSSCSISSRPISSCTWRPSVISCSWLSSGTRPMSRR